MSRPDAMANLNLRSFRPAIGVSVAIVCFHAGRSAVGAIFHVADDAVNDPAPANPLVSDPLEDGSSDHPFDSLQEAVGAGNPRGFAAMRLILTVTARPTSRFHSTWTTRCE